MKTVILSLILFFFISVQSDAFAPASRSGAAIVYPQKGSILSGTVNVRWTLPYIDNMATAYFEISNDDLNYKSIGQDIYQTGMISLNTLEFKDGVFYRIKASVFARNGFLLDVLYTDNFTINNPGNSAPQIILTKPGKYETFSGKYEIKWKAGDAEKDSFRLNIYYRSSYYSPWITVAENIDQSDTAWLWNTENFANADLGSLMVKAISTADTALNAFSIIQPFRLKNSRNSYYSGDYIINRQGQGTGTVWINKMNQSELTGHSYMISFDSLKDNSKLVYNVEDLTLGRMVLSNCTEIDGITESPYFDGIRLVLNNDNVRVIDSSSGLKPGLWYFNMSIRDNFDNQYSMNLPFDYVLEFKNTKSIYSFSQNFPYNGPRVNFVTKNLTRGDTVSVLVYDNDKNGELSLGDEFSIVEFVDENHNGINEYSERKYNWTVSYKNYFDNGQFTEPDSGFKFRIKVTKPFIRGDRVTFSTKKMTNVLQRNTLPEKYVLFQNYPNPFNPETTISYQLPSAGRVKIIIYDLLGRLVSTLVDEYKPTGIHSVHFNSGSLPSGIYVYTIQAGQFRDSKKLMVIK